MGIGPRGPLFVILGSPSLHQGPSGYLVLSYPICPPFCLWGTPQASCSQLALRAQDLGLLWLAWECPMWHGLRSTTAPSPGQVPSPMRLPLCSAPGPEVGVGRAAALPASGWAWLSSSSWAPAANSQTHTLGGQPGLRLGHSIIPVTYL